jgi:hypothetical protein
METKRENEKGFVNVHIDITTKQVYVSNKPYPTMEEAEKGIFYGIGIEKVGCFEIEYTKHEQNVV